MTTESKIEASFCKYIRDGGGEAYKFVSPGRVGVPDRLMLMPVPKEHFDIVAKYVKFIEFKAKGKHPNAKQKREHDQLRAMGYDVRVIDTVEAPE